MVGSAAGALSMSERSDALASPIGRGGAWRGAARGGPGGGGGCSGCRSTRPVSVVQQSHKCEANHPPLCLALKDEQPKKVAAD
ncbi:hypothetical protein Y1Q_0017967 [Alligator mississippiensis]|uniref:Uncharacterized protein n=1 Tax=Alligator mississippiensis TaxID=8496 RepID=A0A151MXZ4_ALLMI|nr:hypothetical protein Y1Q_0017967 [Alligator mississippiensis]